MATLNLGILAHVDAGKTSLTERILFQTGVIAAIGRVDHGDTQTDTLQLERERGITIQNAVASFALGDLQVNLIDTPGHADFIAEVDRALRVLDAVVLVISAVEGVQPQTRRLVQAVRAAKLPLLIFVNKIDRLGARGSELLPEIERALGLLVIAASTPSRLGALDAAVGSNDFADPIHASAVTDTLSRVDDALVARFLELDGALPVPELRTRFVRAVGAGVVVPVLFGSAATGAGVDHLLEGLPWLHAGGEPDADADLSAVVFKIQRGGSGEKIALARMFSGTVAVRDQVALRRPESDGPPWVDEARITGLERFSGTKPESVRAAVAGDIVRVHGSRLVQVGDVLGVPPAHGITRRFPLPTLESIIRPLDPKEAAPMYAALTRLEEQDPLIRIRRGTREPVVSVRLYGEVQKEVIQATLRNEFRIAVAFDASQTLCIERVTGEGAALEVMGDPGNPFVATVGLRVAAGAVDGGIQYHRELGSLPLAFYRAIKETVYATLEEGLFGWAVRDCVVTLTTVGYSAPVSTAADFRKLTPLVLMRAVQRAGVQVSEPVERFTIEAPPAAFGDIHTRLVLERAEVEDTILTGERYRITGRMPAVAVDRVEQLLPGLTGGVGSFRSQPDGYRPIVGDPPVRTRTDCDPLNRKRYLAAVSQM